MKILHLFPYLPTPATFGGASRIYHILKHLVGHHDVTVAGFRERGDLQEFNTTFPELKGKKHFIKRKRVKFRRLMQFASYFTSHSYWYLWSQSPKMERQINNLLEANDFDFILAEFASMGHFDLNTDAIRILDAHNVEYDNFRRMSKLKGSPIRKNFYTREYKKVYHEETQAFKRHDAIFVTSERDGSIIKRDAQTKQFVIPNGVDMDYFNPNGAVEEPFSMVFTGSMGYLPNHEGMMYFLDEIFPVIKEKVPQAKIYIVGNKPRPELLDYQSDSVTITGFVEDVRPYIDQASVFVVPLTMGSGTRLKVVEAFSMRKPVVSTSIGCEGLDVEDGENLIIKDNATAFAEAVVELFEDQQLKSKLITNGYELAKQKYDWSVIGESIDEAFLTLKDKTTHYEGEKIKESSSGIRRDRST